MAETESKVEGGAEDSYRSIEKVIESVRLDREKAMRLKVYVRMGMTAAAFLLGWWGYLTTHAGAIKLVDIANYAYQASQLLVFNMPQGVLHNQIPWQLQVARFALPGLAIYGSVMTYLDMVRAPLATWWAARKRNHVMVVGGSARTLKVTKRCVVVGIPVVVVLPEGDGTVKELRTLGLPVIVGSLDSPDTFQRAGIAGARATLLLAGSDAANLRALLSATEEAERRRTAGQEPLEIACELQSRMMSGMLAASMAERRGGAAECHIIDFDDVIARQLLPVLAPVLGRRDAPHLVMIGSDELALQVARRLLLNIGENGHVTVICENAEAAARNFFQNLPGRTDFLGLHFLQGGSDLAAASDEALEAAMAAGSPHALVISGSDEIAMARTLQAIRWLRARGEPPIPVLVRQRAGQTLARAGRLSIPDGDWAARLATFGDDGDECDPEALLRGHIDRLARAVHQAYLDLSPEGPSAVPWSGLAETFRESCRRQADHVHIKLARLCLEACLEQDGEALVLDPARIEDLAEFEHWRWCVDRWLDGWTLGERKDVAAQISPHLKPYAQLDEAIKEFDRAAVRNIPAVLAAAGLAARPQGDIYGMAR
ncbi:RyR domain-containing protein [Paramagnetospirillum kuznetsovii]|nr:RyR domain-containing protein [Paramagnetospirillum kuznetsovii]